MRYELTDLRLFQAIADSRSLSGGAAAIHITASAASYRLKNLELALGTPLFVRGARGMELTPAGTALLQHVRELFRGIERMHGEAARFSAGLKGNIRLLANSSSLNGFILPSVGRFLNAHPDVNIDLEERSSQDIIAAIAAGEADLGVLAGAVESTQVRSMPYAVDELILAVPNLHPLAGEREIRFGAALEFDFVCPSRTSSNHAFLRETAHRLGRTPNIRLHAPNFDAVLALIETGVGIALVPRSVAGQRLADARVTAVGLAEPWARRHLHMVLPLDGKLPAFARAFADFLLAEPRVADTRDPGHAPMA